MKNILIIILIIVAILFLSTSGEDIQENHTDTADQPKKTYMDTPANTYETRVEAQNIANTIQNTNSYLNSRIDARTEAKKSLEIGNEQMKAREKALESF